MFDSITAIILAIFALALLVSPFVVNAIYQNKAKVYADEIIEGNIVEFNKQIKANAVVVLVRRTIWGLLFLSGFVLNFRAAAEQEFHWLKIVYLIVGMTCITFGVLGYRKELKRLRTLD